MEPNDQAVEAVEHVTDDPQEGLLGALGTEQEDDGNQPQAEAEDAQAAPENEGGEPQKFRVKIKNEAGSDEERDLTLEELAAGFMQGADYTRKTQAAAQAERERQQQFFQAVNQTAEQGRQQIRALQQMVVAAAAPELANVNWQQLAAQDPAQYVQMQAKQQQLNSVLGQLAEQDRQLQQQQQLATQRQREQAMRHSLDYLGREIQGFNLEKEAPKLKDAGSKYGYTPAELDSVVDGRFIHLLHDAAKWRDLQTQKPKALQKVAEAPKVIRPAAPQPKKPNQAALDRLKQTGRASELVNFL